MSGWLAPAVFTVVVFVIGKASKGLLKYVMYIAAAFLFITTVQAALADPWLVSIVIALGLAVMVVMVYKAYRKRTKPPQRVDYYINFPPHDGGRHRR